jgi:hypothetical protein
MTAPTAGFGLGYIIFDPSNFTKSVEQVVALLQQIDRAGEQIRQQRQMLAHLPASALDALRLAEESLEVRVDGVFGEPMIDAATVGARMASWYPIVFLSAEPGWLEAMRPAWMDAGRQQSLAENDLMQHVQVEMAATADRMATLVEASNGVNADPSKLPGIVATAQAHVELLAIASGEIDKLLAIRTARARRHAETRAQAQSESAYRTARRNDLLIDWARGGQEQPQAIVNPFVSNSD